MPVTATWTADAVLRRSGTRLPKRAESAMAAFAAAPLPRRSRAVFRWYAGFWEEIEAGGESLVVTLLTTVAGAGVTGAEATAAGCPPSEPLACAELADTAHNRPHATNRPARPSRRDGQAHLAHVNIRSV